MTITQKEQGYQKLCQLVNITPLSSSIDLCEFSIFENLSNKSANERLTAALQVFIEQISNDVRQIERIDKVLLDRYIAKIDELLGAQLDAILHNPRFQEIESSWRALHQLVSDIDFRANIKLEILDVDKKTLHADFNEVLETSQSGLFKHIYVQEYDTPGGEPFSVMIGNYEFNLSAEDTHLLTELSHVASAAHCPFIGSVGANFFNKTNFQEVAKIDDLSNYMERSEYIRWNSFRESDDARYIGLTLPKFLLRLPYGENNPIRYFCYEEQVRGETSANYLWGNASFSFATNMARSFKKYGWTVNICGPESGGKVEQLPLHHYDVGKGLQTKIPSEIIIPEMRELEYANLGFIPLSYYKNSDFACFFSANSVKKPMIYSNAEATANSRINARLPYVLLSSKLGHYLKVIQRENIGTHKNRLELESELNGWLQSLITRMNKPGPELAATHPLRDGKVSVDEDKNNPGFYRISMYAVPHFQIEGIDIKLSLISQLPIPRGAN